MIVALLSLATIGIGQQAPPRPAFTARTDVALVDVQVVTDDGAPILDLQPDDFTVELDGDRRSIVAVDLVRYDQAVGIGSPVRPVAT